MELLDGTSSLVGHNSYSHINSTQNQPYYQQNPLGYSNIHKQKKDFFDQAGVPNMIDAKTRRLSATSLTYDGQRSPSPQGSRPRSPHAAYTPNINSKVSTPKAPVTTTSINLNALRDNSYPVISHHFLEVYSNNVSHSQFDLENHMEMRRRFHNSILQQAKEKNTKKPQ